MLSLPLGAASESKVNGEHKTGGGHSRLLTKADMRKALQVSDRKFDELRAQGIVPAPLNLGPRCARWTPEDLAAMVAGLQRRELGAEPETLAQGRRARIEAAKTAGAGA
jgi:predicted DNA-binding transcriptional regulator AlpA